MAGKGFAVVADEVKQLAQETARATEDISRRVEAIQADTALATGTIGDIAAVIKQINDFQVTISADVEEQTATTNTMSRSVGEAATGSLEIAANVSGIADSVESVRDQANQTRGLVTELAGLARDLNQLVATFRH